MDRVVAVGQHAFGQAIEAPADLAMEGGPRTRSAPPAGISFSRSAAGELCLEFGDPDFQSCQALSQLAYVIRAVPR